MDGYLDRELDPVTNQAIEQHLENCASCEGAYQAHAMLVRAVGNTTPYYKAPAELRERIQFSLRQEITERPMHNSRRDSQILRRSDQPGPRTVIFGTQWSRLALAASVVLAGIVAFALFPRMQRPGANQFLATQLIASHVRSLMANHLTDVASSDQHTVKPWLDTKLDFAPGVIDLNKDGFPLVGGRLDYLDNRPVAALVYQRRKHFINLFVWPIEPGTTANTDSISRQGYHLLHWTDSDFNYWAVSDVNGDDLLAFKQLLEKQVPHR